MPKYNVRSIGLFIVACFTSPCCTPLIVPLVLALLAGTPVALWLGANLGWMYGGLTVISVISLVLGMRQWNKPKPALTPAPIIRLADIGEQKHV